MFFLKKLIATLAMPLPIALVLSMAGVVFLLRRRRRTGALLIGSALLGLFLASWGPVADVLMEPLERRHPPVLDASRHSESVAVVVLGSGFSPSPFLPITSQLSDSGLVRLTEGIRLYRQLPGVRLVFTGGPVFGSGAAARGYAEAALALGVPFRDMVVLDTPRDTSQEALVVRELLGRNQPFLLVTSASHMARAVLLFQRAGLAPIPAPTRHKSFQEDWRHVSYWMPSARHLGKTERAIYEYMGLLDLSLRR
jgi:uncharacterized SAM-binding protein YcdF (DUF218 family)